ncbi:transposase [Aquimarina sp. RZ0]|nr:transposase [Aquimarina sp. RZ0]
MKEAFKDVFNIPISEGGIHCLLERFANKATATYEFIKEQVSNSEVIGSDETGAKVNGQKHWMWVWQTSDATYITHSETRGKLAIEDEFPEGFTQSVLVSDGWRPQLSTPYTIKDASHIY